MIDFIKLAPLQEQLDAHIRKKRSLEGQDLLLNTIFALQVEVAELANKVRFFKHWSTNQEPRTYAFEELDAHQVREWNPVLEEYVDSLHFLLSIGNQLGVDWKQIDVSDEGTFGIPRAFGRLALHISQMWQSADAYKLSGSIRMKIQTIHFLVPVAELLTDIGRLLEFNAEEIEAAYMDKHKVNYDRQANGY